MLNNDSLSKLKQRMEGKTVLRVEPPQATEAICRFHMSDGSVFRLHATDLGFWVEDTIAPEASYPSLDMLFREYEHHTYYMKEKTPTEVEIATFSTQDPDLEVVITAPDGRVFKATVSKDSEDGQLLSRSNVVDRLKEAADLGNVWKFAFEAL